MSKSYRAIPPPTSRSCSSLVYLSFLVVHQLTNSSLPFSISIFSVWPNSLVLCALFNTLHSQSYAGIGPHGGAGLSRERFFAYAFLSAGLWCEFFSSVFPTSVILRQGYTHDSLDLD